MTTTRGAAPLRVAVLARSLGAPLPALRAVEQFASLLTEGLVERGVDVTLFATGDSVTAARLVSVVPARVLGGYRRRT